ncbi:hypothetical protein [Streptomyces spectabilis]|uniref:Uncharacterized protein n=1 Tax=Streptomyces spectabilis TaxID=68270 RepID=A0A516RIM7_STRST|nr:hypothetical protein [Streptomyces spectabilis]QDQ15518.1 hypothetical protein FH965_37240 [Streptomyces spectabilis]
MTPDEEYPLKPTHPSQAALGRRESGGHPPLTPHTLTNLFGSAREGAVRPTSLSLAYGIGEAVGAAIDGVRRGLDEEGLDPHTRYQLTHVLDALSTAVTETVRSVLTRPPAVPPAPRFMKSPKDKRKSRRTTGAPPPLPGLALDAVGKALPHVEKAFGKWPPTAGPPAPPWYEHDVVMELIQDLVSLRDRGRADRVWDRVGVFREVLRDQGIEILAYDPQLRPERQADAFSVEHVTEDVACRYETDLPALVRDPEGDGRRVLVRGRVLRLPVASAPERNDHGAQNEENDR